MKKLFSKKWCKIPVGIIVAVIAVVAISIGAFASYNFVNQNVSMEVREPMTVWYNLSWDSPDAGWVKCEGNTLTDACTAGDIATVDFKVQNKASAPIKVVTDIIDPSGFFSFVGVPNGNIPAASGATPGETTFTATISVSPEATPADYGFSFGFSRTNPDE